MMDTLGRSEEIEPPPPGGMPPPRDPFADVTDISACEYVNPGFSLK